LNARLVPVSSDSRLTHGNLPLHRLLKLPEYGFVVGHCGEESWRAPQKRGARMQKVMCAKRVKRRQIRLCQPRIKSRIPKSGAVQGFFLVLRMYFGLVWKRLKRVPVVVCGRWVKLFGFGKRASKEGAHRISPEPPPLPSLPGCVVVFRAPLQKGGKLSGLVI